MLKLGQVWQVNIPLKTCRTYQESLDDLTDEQIERAFALVIRNATGDRLPKVADLRKAVGMLQTDQYGNYSAAGTAGNPQHRQVDDRLAVDAVFSFLPMYDYCPINCNPCDGTMGGKCRVGCCGFDRWQIHRAVAWAKKHGIEIPRNVIEWMGRNGLLPKSA
jgi:hypothetical protein